MFPCPRCCELQSRFRDDSAGVCMPADLGATGEIVFEGQFFKSPSAFSVFVKRKVRLLLLPVSHIAVAVLA